MPLVEKDDQVVEQQWKRGVIRVSMQILHDLLDLPAHVEVLHVAPGNSGLTLDLVVTSPHLPYADPAAYPPDLMPSYMLVDGRPKMVGLSGPGMPDVVPIDE